MIAPVHALDAWASFYVIVGSSAGAMTGLQFVVMTLVAQSTPGRSRGDTISAFGTPNVVHFCAALLVSALLTVPWGSLRAVGAAIAVCGLLGVFYSIIVLRRAHRQDDYQPVLEDWIWHNILPVLSYSTLLVSGVALDASAGAALFAIGAAALLLVFIGIHNAWDTVTFLMMRDAAAKPAVASAAPVVAAPSVPVAKVAKAPEAGGGSSHEAAVSSTTSDRPQ